MLEGLVIAIDGGGTRTRLRLVNGSGRRREREAGASSLTLAGAGAWAVIRDALRAEGIDDSALADARLGLGLAGANDARQRDAFLAAAPRTAGLALATDAYAALLGAHAGAPGAILIAGTGSVGCRLLADGALRLVGGWGFPAGDEGSGAWLGRRAMGLATQAHDGRAADGPLTRAIIAHCGTTRADLLGWLRGAPSTRFAELAPLVLQAADSGDAAAQGFAAAAGRQLDRLAVTLDPGRTTPLALLGGLAAPLAPYLPAELRSWLRPPQGSALDGAERLARGEAPPERLAP